MPRLSIIIPAIEGAATLEQSLVSVLENRPQDSEIVVVDAFGYDDPYDLRDEVRLIDSAGLSRLSDCVQLGLKESRGDVVHLLAAGGVVEPDWAEAALEHLREPNVASVAPLVMRENNRESVVAAGIDYHRGGMPIWRAYNQRHFSDLEIVDSVLGGILAAAFYRRDAVLDAGGLDASLDTPFVEIDLALRLRHGGWKAVYEPQSRVYLPGHCEAISRGGYTSGWQAERVFWRNLPVAGGWSGVLLHPMIVAYECVRRLPRLEAVSHLVGRMAAGFHSTDHRDYQGLLEEVEQGRRRTLQLAGPHRGAASVKNLQRAA